MMAGAMGSKRSQRKEQNRLPPFVPLLVATLDTPALQALSHGAKVLYISLKRRCPNARNRAYLSYRQAEREIRASRRKIGEWFRELEYYGFIALEQHGCLGVEGKGKAPHWRLTEKGIAGHEHPTNDFLRWNGVPFKRTGDRRQARFQAFLEKQNPGDGVGNGVVTAWETPPVTAWETPNPESGDGGVAIGRGESGDGGVAISSIATTRALSPSHGKPWTKPTITDLGERRLKPRRRKSAGRA